MASLKKRLPANAPGDFYVDATCIDCDTCRWMAPETFAEKDGKSYVHTQPGDPERRLRALKALTACPTASIGTEARHDMAPVFEALPDSIEGNVFHCGFHAEDSFGAAPYLIVRPQGNILIDSPRFASPLVKRLEALGGVKTLFLTHGDDVADHRKFKEHFGCERILHAGDVRASTEDVEFKLEGEEAVRWDKEILFLPTPGHTKGSACLLYRDRFLFTGDHLAWDDDANRLEAFRNACWYDWKVQRESMKRLADYSFGWVLPGHGRRVHLPADRMATELQRLVEWMA
ncbi:MAG TPA: MBL fold metallo-hydrolase [bacterium]|nr:MBL fold metallo-hydrolase [bacterium]